VGRVVRAAVGVAGTMMQEAIVEAANQEPKRQHHTPVFYLRRWGSDDGRVHVIRNFNGKIARSWRAPKYLGFEDHLYSYSEDFRGVDRAEIETQFLAPLDNEGARIVNEVIARKPMEIDDCVLWTLFLTTMRVRTPENVEKIKVEASNALVREIESAQPEYEKIRDNTDPATAVDWLKMNPQG
jgi:Protein of unknown function (DUF4238)